MRKTPFLLLLVLTLLLAACTPDNSETARSYLNALNNRDLTLAADLVCPARLDDVTMGLTTVDDPNVEPYTFQGISCAARGADVACRFTIDQFTADAEDTSIQRTREVVFAFEDGKVCGFEEQVAE